jgi:predicted phage tail protein
MSDDFRSPRQILAEREKRFADPAAEMQQQLNDGLDLASKAAADFSQALEMLRDYSNKVSELGAGMPRHHAQMFKNCQQVFADALQAMANEIKVDADQTIEDVSQPKSNVLKAMAVNGNVEGAARPPVSNLSDRLAAFRARPKPGLDGPAPAPSPFS